jgi:hypothetical protein
MVSGSPSVPLHRKPPQSCAVNLAKPRQLVLGHTAQGYLTLAASLADTGFFGGNQAPQPPTKKDV